jgi:GTPase SAR1 family protein
VGVIIVYDITSRRSFEHVVEWLNEAEANIAGPDPDQIVFMLIGHKADLEEKREVLYEVSALSPSPYCPRPIRLLT